MAANGSFGCRQRQCDPYFQCVHVGVISVHACTQTCQSREQCTLDRALHCLASRRRWGDSKRAQGHQRLGPPTVELSDTEGEQKEDVHSDCQQKLVTWLDIYTETCQASMPQGLLLVTRQRYTHFEIYFKYVLVSMVFAIDILQMVYVCRQNSYVPSYLTFKISHWCSFKLHYSYEAHKVLIPCIFPNLIYLVTVAV